jgi:hypothetical protein
MATGFRAWIVGGPFDGVSYEAAWPPPRRLELRVADGCKAVHELRASAGKLIYYFRRTTTPFDPPTWTIEYVGLPAIDGYARTIEWPPAELPDQTTLTVGAELFEEDDFAFRERTAVFELRESAGQYRYHFLHWQESVEPVGPGRRAGPLGTGD